MSKTKETDPKWLSTRDKLILKSLYLPYRIKGKGKNEYPLVLKNVEGLERYVWEGVERLSEKGYIKIVKVHVYDEENNVREWISYKNFLENGQDYEIDKCKFKPLSSALNYFKNTFDKTLPKSKVEPKKNSLVKNKANKKISIKFKDGYLHINEFKKSFGGGQKKVMHNFWETREKIYINKKGTETTMRKGTSQEVESLTKAGEYTSEGTFRDALYDMREKLEALNEKIGYRCLEIQNKKKGDKKYILTIFRKRLK